MAAGVNKLHLPLVAWPTHPHYYHVAEEGQSRHKEAPLPQNGSLFAHNDWPSKGLG